MNDFRNMGNANAALATLNFNHHDHLADKFLHRVFRLIGEDAPKALVDNYFNEERVMDALNKILEEIPIPNIDLPRLANMDHYFHWLACTWFMQSRLKMPWLKPWFNNFNRKMPAANIVRLPLPS